MLRQFKEFVVFNVLDWGIKHRIIQSSENCLSLFYISRTNLPRTQCDSKGAISTFISPKHGKITRGVNDNYNCTCCLPYTITKALLVFHPYIQHPPVKMKIDLSILTTSRGLWKESKNKNDGYEMQL